MKITLKTVIGFAEYAVDIPVKVFTFSGGEEQVRLDGKLEELCTCGDTIIVEQEIRSSSDFMRLAMTKDAIDRVRAFGVDVVLVMLYVPYARQDRVCEPGEALALRKFADMLNALKFDRVIVADPHSDVASAVIDNIQIIPQEDIVKMMLDFYITKNNFALVSPDAGALKKIHKVSKALGGVDVFCAEKVRDTLTGDILLTKIDVEDFEGRNLIMVDDICDGGRTFVELAKLLKQRGAGRIDLYVTHGIFSRGIDNLEGLIQNVHSLNVWEGNLEASGDRKTDSYLIRNQDIVKKELLEEIL